MVCTLLSNCFRHYSFFDVRDLLKNSHFLERNWLRLGLLLGLLKNTLEIVEAKYERDVS